ncbi:MAG: hypothetical protein GWO87_01420 [Xanthomonadaceae bacterium]|nr:hypothetical protein [Rhodospirillaceae bacterium]NIA17836.1 hypothetical protein [Xanthomonadaceae bacterium]
MESRKLQLLNYTVRNYIKTAQPVGSNLLLKKSGLNLSSATIRNDLMDLENSGYIYQPYTSAGRVPTEQGYKFWINSFLKEKELRKNKKQFLKDIKRRFKKDKEKSVKEIAKAIASMSKAAVIVGFSRDSIYYTGISYLFSQPEFKNYKLIRAISEVVDDLEKSVPDLFDKIEKNKIMTLVGSDNPFSDKCSALVVSFDKNGLFSLLGPLRMNYEENRAIISFLKKII